MEESILQSLRDNPWIISMLKCKLFHEECDQHSNKKRCFFCIDCMTPPFCQMCKCNKITSEHDDHNLLQAFRSSNQSGVRIDTISRFLDLAGIQDYAINGFRIVYINQRKQKEKEHSVRKNGTRPTRNCVVCGWQLDPTSAARVCSIECQIKNVLGSKFDEFADLVANPVKKPVKRDGRKGIPVRSPFF